MPFGPTNVPTFYTVIMRNFKEERDKLFMARVLDLGHVNGEKIALTTVNAIIVAQDYCW